MSRCISGKELYKKVQVRILRKHSREGFLCNAREAVSAGISRLKLSFYRECG
jgi:hypothetical protein